MMRNAALLFVFLLAACGGGKEPATTPVPSGGVLTEAQLDSLWTDATALLANRKWNDAITALERLNLEFPARDPRRAAARFMVAEARLGEKSNLQAVREFRRVADDFPADSLAPEALKRAGDAYARLWRRPELDPTYGMQALSTYQEVLTRFPTSPAAAASRERIADLEDMFAVKNYKSALFYIRYKAYDSAILYLKDIVATYPRTEVVPEVISSLVEIYQDLGYVEEVTEVCTFFRRVHPEAPNLAETCPVVAGATGGS